MEFVPKGNKMYSYEISQILSENNYNIDSETYLHISSTSPQLTQVKYNSWSDDFEMWDRENYWKFTVYKKENKGNERN